MQRMILSFIVILVLSGCAGVMNPYSSDFQCPETDKGKCVSVQTAYREGTGKSSDRTTEKKASPREERNVQKDIPSGAALYQSALYDRLNRLLTRPDSPVVVPPRVMRVLILPYTGDERELYMYRYVYMFVDEPRWLLENLLSGSGEDGK